MVFVFNRDNCGGKGKLAADLFVFKIRNSAAILDLPQAGGGAVTCRKASASMVFPPEPCETRAMFRMNSVELFFHVQTS